ncbi:nucleolar and coiled-body phosphoprotein 1 [Latimeria chalumnae]|uniref:NADH:ubiquinone oxidoreductase subunit V3 n=1 Tax=Latimeria chalumnae TaxID=7897 RepID=H3ALE9_LATCH|nr:PREDICTED: NADH dehydrogenase [ubiquinone] flavoprotein 3, mitochondrial [Latimeria chalumnae]XP_014349889.1 PREDICTED: NADH dehydrogenase [ubiquinone] flavoprotein 3, mitochondrial [Latimeria chalumnae]XP_014349890.1 PREDICTED: NADH dehydrogenase [ubiquinone] flavoprotein 3, mitochondrial [Latimeria chalumnae]|eukprot:XP_014349888.1 PREDICTED: NADH dehydrogenase [ubiquinone] flavoprotein 3, mitochondrial [Latimeria chalumnae]
MAASLLRAGRAAGAFKTLQLEAWGLGRPALLAKLCTKSVDPQASKNVVAPVERAKLLARKTAVEFPKRLSSPMSCPPAKGETVASTSSNEVVSITEEERANFLSRKTLVVFPQRVQALPPPADESPKETNELNENRARLLAYKTLVEFPKRDQWPTLGAKMAVPKETLVAAAVADASVKREGELETKEPREEETSSSSSSDSDSDSDSDHEEEEIAVVIRKAKVELSDRERSVSNKELGLTVAERLPKMAEAEPTLRSASTEQARATPKKHAQPLKIVTAPPAGGLLESGNGSAALKQTETQKGEISSEMEPIEKIVLVEKTLVAEPVLQQLSAAQDVAEGKAEPEENVAAMEETVLRTTEKDAVREGKEIVSEEKTPVLTAEVSEEIFPETVAQSEPKDAPQEEEAAAAPTEQEFDISTYKNLQHHDYNTYTFLDLDLELSKSRLPQPSSGRESPRH